MYSCSPRWRPDWISESDLKNILELLVNWIKPAPFGSNSVGINYGLHFTGGEPFLNVRLLGKAIMLAEGVGIPSVFVETNSFWCVSDEYGRNLLSDLRDRGLDGLLVSVNPFLIEFVPFERIRRAALMGLEVFGENLIVYQGIFFQQFENANLKGRVSLEEYIGRFEYSSLMFAELIPMGRACVKLRHLFEKRPAKAFFSENCRNSLLRGWHAHIDNYGNYITGYCGGLSLGNARRLDELIEVGVDLDERLILGCLIAGSLKGLYEFAVREFNYVEREGGYISKCDLCLDIRKHIALRVGRDEFPELAPREFYAHLEE